MGGVRKNTVNVTSDAIHPNVLYLDRDAETVLVQVDVDTYEVWRGRWHLGDVKFYDGDRNYGWHFASRTTIFRNSRKLFPHPEAALATRGITVVTVEGLTVDASNTY